jgi:hypothetical protein
MKNKEVTPFEEWEKKRLTLSYSRTWGCLAKVSVRINKKRKLGPKTVDCVFLGYAFHSVGYRFLVVRSGVPDLLVGEGIRGGYASAKQELLLSETKQELLPSEITGLPLDAQMQRNRVDVDKRVEGSRQCSFSRPS